MTPLRGSRRRSSPPNYPLGSRPFPSPTRPPGGDLTDLLRASSQVHLCSVGLIQGSPGRLGRSRVETLPLEPSPFWSVHPPASLRSSRPCRSGLGGSSSETREKMSRPNRSMATDVSTPAALFLFESRQIRFGLRILDAGRDPVSEGSNRLPTGSHPPIPSHRPQPG
jgi:hypothetical protein